MWSDELALSENILGRSLRDLLTRPLEFDQVSPPGFLTAVKLSTRVFGTSELALRLFPLLFSLAALGLFPAVARRLLPRTAALLATWLFAIGIPFYVVGSELKQYSADVAAALLLTWLALDLLEAPTDARRLRRAALVGAAALWFSQPAALVVAGISAALVLGALRRGGPRELKPLLPLLALWAASAAIAVGWSLHLLTPDTRQFMDRFWDVKLSALRACIRRRDGSSTGCFHSAGRGVSSSIPGRERSSPWRRSARPSSGAAAANGRSLCSLPAL